MAVATELSKKDREVVARYLKDDITLFTMMIEKEYEIDQDAAEREAERIIAAIRAKDD